MTKNTKNKFTANLDFNLVEGFAVVDTNNGSNHFRDDDHVPQVGLDALETGNNTHLNLSHKQPQNDKF